MGIVYLIVPGPKIISFPFTLLGILFLFLGLWMNLWASNHFKKVNTTVKPFETSSQLVKQGFFSISRHPMYLGMASALLGIAILLGYLLPFVIIPVFTMVINRKFIVPEEQMLLNTFGEEYREYQNQVRRWI